MDNNNFYDSLDASSQGYADAMKVLGSGLENMTESFLSMNMQTSRMMDELSKAISLHLEDLTNTALQTQTFSWNLISDALLNIVSQRTDIATILHSIQLEDAANVAETAIETAFPYIPEEHRPEIALELHQKKSISLGDILSLFGLLLAVFTLIYTMMTDRQQQEYERQRDLAAQQQSEAIQQQNEAIYVVLDGLQDAIVLLNEQLQEAESANSAEIDTAESDAQAEDSNADEAQ